MLCILHKVKVWIQVKHIENYSVRLAHIRPGRPMATDTETQYAAVSMEPDTYSDTHGGEAHECERFHVCSFLFGRFRAVAVTTSVCG